MDRDVLDWKECSNELVLELTTEIRFGGLGSIDSVGCFAQGSVICCDGAALYGAEGRHFGDMGDRSARSVVWEGGVLRARISRDCGCSCLRGNGYAGGLSLCS